jgi:hypothetical protein
VKECSILIKTVGLPRLPGPGQVVHRTPPSRDPTLQARRRCPRAGAHVPLTRIGRSTSRLPPSLFSWHYANVAWGRSGDAGKNGVLSCRPASLVAFGRDGLPSQRRLSIDYHRWALRSEGRNYRERGGREASMRELCPSEEGRSKAEVVVGPVVVLAHQVVPRMESLPEVSGGAGIWTEPVEIGAPEGVQRGGCLVTIVST